MTRIRDRRVTWTVILGVSGMLLGLKLSYWNPEYILYGLIAGSALGFSVGLIFQFFSKKSN